MSPAATEHRRDDVDLRELLGAEVVRVAVEHHEIGEETGNELPAAMLVAREPRRATIQAWKPTSSSQA